MGLHFGDELPAGSAPVQSTGGTDDLGNAGNGLAWGLDGGLRFGRVWYVGGIVEHAELGSLQHKPNTTMLGAQIALITNPDKVSFYFGVGGDIRWYSLPNEPVLNGGEFFAGLGLWIPIANIIRLVPEITASFGSYALKSGSTTVGTTTITTSSDQQGHEFFMLGVAGFYNLDI
jgi:hypothetical protein